MGNTHNKMVKDKNIRDAGLKVTLPRVRILEIFESSDQKHLSADEVYKKLIEAGDEVGLATVYRVLTQFESADILMKHNFESGHSVYELMPDDHHDHMVCMETGKVIEFNEGLEDTPEDVNSDPYEAGWMIKLKISDTSEIDSLLSDADYKALIGA